MVKIRLTKSLPFPKSQSFRAIGLGLQTRISVARYERPTEVLRPVAWTIVSRFDWRVSNLRQRGIVAQRARSARMRDLAGQQHMGAIRDRQRHGGGLVDQQDGHSSRIQSPHARDGSTLPAISMNTLTSRSDISFASCHPDARAPCWCWAAAWGATGAMAALVNFVPTASPVAGRAQR